MESQMASLYVANNDTKKSLIPILFVLNKTTIFTCVWMEGGLLPTEKSDILTDIKHISLYRLHQSN